MIDPETGAETTVPTPEDTMKKIEALVIDAIGIDANRGDSLTVSSSAFIKQLEGVEAPWYEQSWMRSAINQFAMILILAIVVMGIIRPLLSRILVPVATTSTALADGEDDIDLDQIEVGEGESLEDIKAKLKPKSKQSPLRC